MKRRSFELREYRGSPKYYNNTENSSEKRDFQTRCKRTSSYFEGTEIYLQVSYLAVKIFAFPQKVAQFLVSNREKVNSRLT